MIRGAKNKDQVHTYLGTVHDIYIPFPGSRAGCPVPIARRVETRESGPTAGKSGVLRNGAGERRRNRRCRSASVSSTWLLQQHHDLLC